MNGFKRYFLAIVLLFSVSQTALVAGDKVEVSGLTQLQQIYILQQLMPKIQQVGILCDLHQHPKLEEAMKRVSALRSIKVVIADTKELSSVAKNFRELVSNRKVDIVWVFPDEPFKNSSAMSYLIKEAVLAKVMLVVEDQDLVDKGATISSVKVNDVVQVFINKKSADLLSLNVPNNLVEELNITFK